VADISPLLARKLLLVTGKGGIGKTMVAATLGQASAAAGRSTLLVESAATDQLAPLFGAPSSPKHEEVKVGPNLAVVNLEPSENFREYVVKYLGQRLLYETVFSHRLVKTFINTIPGLAELMMLGRLFYQLELASGPRHQALVFDGYASGHFLSLMTTPDAVLQTNIGGPVAKESERVKGFLADREKTGIVYVATPEELVVSEVLDFLPKLVEKSPAKLLALVINKVPAPLGAPFGSPSTGAAAQYLAHQDAAARNALELLARGLERLKNESGLDLPVYRIEDLGVVPEPFPVGFGPDLWRAAAEGLAR